MVAPIYCRAYIKPQKFRCDRVYFGDATYNIYLETKTTLHMRDRAIAKLRKIRWIAVTILDLQNNIQERVIYLRSNEIARFLLIAPQEVFRLSRQALSEKFQQAMSWKYKAKMINEPFCKKKTYELVCKYITENRKIKRQELLASGETVLKIKKSNLLPKSVYFVKHRTTSKVKIFIHLGKEKTVGKGSFKQITLAIDFDKWRFQTLAKPTMSAYASNDFENEIKCMSQFINSRSLLMSHYSGQRLEGSQRQYYIFSSFCDMGDLMSRIGKLSAKTNYFVMKDIITGISAMHAAGIVHQDLKPGNILLYKCKKTGQIRAKVCDFGLSRKIHASTVRYGNRPYSSPAKLRCNNFPVANDIWGVGLISYELLYGPKIYNGLQQKPGISQRYLAKAYEAKYLKDLPHATGPLNQLIFGMMNPDPNKALKMSAVKKAFRRLTLQDFVIDPKIKEIFSKV